MPPACLTPPACSTSPFCIYAVGLFLQHWNAPTQPACFYAAGLFLRRHISSTSLVCLFYAVIVIAVLSYCHRSSPVPVELLNTFPLCNWNILFHLQYCFSFSFSNYAYEVCDFCVALSATFLSNIIFTLLSRADLECLKYCHVPAKFAPSLPHSCYRSTLVPTVRRCQPVWASMWGGRGILLMYSAS
jgi:hypothetical protein